METLVNPPKAYFKADRRGIWEHPDGYELSNRQKEKGWLRRFKIVYDYTPNWDYPLTWVQSDGTRMTVGSFKRFDWGSIPIAAQGWLPRDGSLGYIPHDFAYRTGGLFFWVPKEKQWIFHTITRAESDMLLRVMVQRDPVSRIGKYRAFMVWSAVRTFALCRFKTWKPGRPVPQWPVSERPDVDDPPIHA